MRDLKTTWDLSTISEIIKIFRKNNFKLFHYANIRLMKVFLKISKFMRTLNNRKSLSYTNSVILSFINSYKNKFSNCYFFYFLVTVIEIFKSWVRL